MKTTKTEKLVGTGIIVGALAWIVIVLGVLGVVVWAIIKLVIHFTA